MDADEPRAALAALIRERREDCAGLSRLLGRNPSYVQQYLTRGSPRRLAEADRAVLARYFAVAESVLGGPPEPARAAVRTVPRLAVAVSAGPGAEARDGPAVAAFTVSEAWLSSLAPAGGGGGVSMVEVVGTSMLPTLKPGDELLVDTADTGLRDGIFALRIGDALHVKRLRCAGGRVAILSDNPDADPVAFDGADPPAIVGRVLWAGRRL